MNEKINNLNYSSSLYDCLDVFNYDLKNSLNLADADDSIDKIMRFFCSKSRDLEKHETAKEGYRKLGWNQDGYYDVINSFWTIYTCSLAIFDEFPKRRLYKFEKDNDDYEKVVMDGSSVKSIENYVGIKKEYYVSDYMNYMEGLHPGNRSNDKKTMYGIVHKLYYLQNLAKICHTLSNFMPCPGDDYNSAKGCIDDVNDFLPLMIDKIQKCVDDNKDINYTSNGKTETLTVKILKSWREWFIVKRKEYALEDYYNIVYISGKKKIVGISLFKNQSLEHPLPLTQVELKECVDEIIRRYKIRTLRLIGTVINNV